jgi:SAM-dependent methyltransferase
MEDRPGMQGAQGAENWTAYFDAVAGLPPRDTLLKALELYESERNRDREGAGGHADPSRLASPLVHARGSVIPFGIDLGCGDGRDTLELLRRGWRVLAIDGSADGIARLQSRVPPEHAPNLQTHIGLFEAAPLPRADLINASFSIPHCAPTDFPPMWTRIVEALSPGGRFAGQLFGVRDDWATRPDGITRTYHSREQVDAMLEPFEVELLDEVERPGKTAMGDPKYWHVFHIVARKRGVR